MIDVINAFRAFAAENPRLPFREVIRRADPQHGPETLSNKKMQILVHTVFRLDARTQEQDPYDYEQVCLLFEWLCTLPDEVIDWLNRKCPPRPKKTKADSDAQATGRQLALIETPVTKRSRKSTPPPLTAIRQPEPQPVRIAATLELSADAVDQITGRQRPRGAIG